MIREEIAKASCGAATIVEGTATQEFCFKPDFSGFSGHFPGYPILPAVIQVLLGQLVVEQAYGQTLQFLSLGRAKFVRELHPNCQIRVESVVTEKEDGLRARTKLFCDAEMAADFILQLKGASE